MAAYDSVEAQNTLVKRSSETLTWAVDVAPLLENGEVVTGVLEATIVKQGGTASIAGGPTLSGNRISVVLTGGDHSDQDYKVRIAYTTSLHTRREVVGPFIVKDFD